MENYQKLHNSSILVDLHNDYLEERTHHPEHRLFGNNKHQTDLRRLKEGGVNVEFFVIWTRPEEHEDHFARALELIDTLNADVDECGGEIVFAKKYTEILSVVAQEKIAAVLCLEGGQLVGNKIENIDVLYNKGMRYLTLAWNYGTDWCGGAKDEPSKGFGGFGRDVVDKLNQLSVMIDVSHVNHKSLDDVLSYTDATVVATHSGAFNVNSVPRNLYDAHIKEIARRGGVIGAVFYPWFLNNTEKADISDVMKHINYIANLTGTVDNIAIGSDFDGIDITPVGLEDVSKFPNLTKAMIADGYTQEEIAKMLGGNALRVFKQVCG